MFDPIFAHDCLRVGNQRWFLVLRRVYAAYVLAIFLWFVEQKTRGILDGIRPYWLASFAFTLPCLTHGPERFFVSVAVWLLCLLLVRLFAGCGIACSAGS